MVIQCVNSPPFTTITKIYILGTCLFLIIKKIYCNLLTMFIVNCNEAKDNKENLIIPSYSQYAG